MSRPSADFAGLSLMNDRALAKKVLQTRASFSGTFELTPKDTLNALECEEGRLGVFGNPFEVVALGDICNASPPLLSEYCNQFFLQVGRWVDEIWTMTLVMLLAPTDPLGDHDTWDASMMLFIERDFEPAKPNIEVLIDTEIGIYLKDELLREKGFPPGSRPLVTVTHVFTTEDNVKVVVLDYKYWKYLMSMYHQRGSIEFDIVFEITASERTRDLIRANLGVLQVNNDIRHIIMGELDLRSIQNLETGLHKQPRPPGMQTEAIAMYRFRVCLIRYFPDPSEFAAIMLQTGTIIGGSTALSIVAGGTWAPGDLDLIVTQRYLPRLVDYLMQQGYRLNRDINGERRGQYVHDAENEPLYRFEYYCFTKGDLKIDISQCFCTRREAMTPANFILTYHMSFVMNFVSGEGIYSFFPNETFSGRGYKNSFTLTTRLDHILLKYAARGYKGIVDERTGRPVYLQDRFRNHESGRFKVQSVKNIWFMKLPLLSKRNHSV